MTDPKRIWFFSDTHFGHAGIIERCNRPFSDVQEMDAILIRNYQERVQPGDRVFFLGDFAYRDHQKILRRLPGDKYLIVGNHDWDRSKGITDKRKAELVAWGFSWVRDTYLLPIKGGNPKHIWLAHYPHRTWPKMWKGSWHLFGHSHGKSEDVGLSTDVGVDCWNYAPVSLRQLQKHFEGREPPSNEAS